MCESRLPALLALFSLSSFLTHLPPLSLCPSTILYAPLNGFKAAAGVETPIMRRIGLRLSFVKASVKSTFCILLTESWAGQFIRVLMWLLIRTA
jgi:hypothetical protein